MKIFSYRKINLGANETNLTPGNETSSFETDFGVKFGLITNEDLFSVNPSETILQDGSIKDVIVPMSWENHFPFDICKLLIFSQSHLLCFVVFSDFDSKWIRQSKKYKRFSFELK